MVEPHDFTRRASQIACLLLVLIAAQWGGVQGTVYAANKESGTSNKNLSETVTKKVASAKKNKQEFEQYIREQFHDLEEKAQALREKGAELHETTKSKLNDKYENLKEQKQELLSKIEDLRQTSENAWKDIREGILSTMSGFEPSLSQPTPTK